MVKRFIIFITLLIIASCAEKEPEGGQTTGVFQMVSNMTGIASVFSNAGSSVRDVNFTGTTVKANFPPTSTRLIAVMPSLGITEGRANSVRMEIPLNQEQETPGIDHMNGCYYYSKAQAADNPVKFEFSQMGGTIAIQIDPVSGEKLQGVTLSQKTSGIAGVLNIDLFKKSVIEQIPGGGTSVSVSLSEACSLTEPAVLYLHVSAVKLTGIELKIVTAARYYHVILSRDLDFSTPCEKSIAVNLKSQEVKVDGQIDENASVYKSGDGDFSSLLLLDEDAASIDRIPDFSRVGYKYGDEPVPSPAVKETIDMASISAALADRTAADTTDYFQKVIDRVGTSGGGAIMVKNGTYNVSRILFIDKDNVVLRGESQDGTVIMYNSMIQAPVIFIGRTQMKKAGENPTNDLAFIADRRVKINRMKAAGNSGNSSFGDVYIVTYSPYSTDMTFGSNSLITEEYVPLGRLWVEVANPRLFKEGDPVRIWRKPNQEWITSIGMDRIADNGRATGSETWQWDISTYTMNWTRKVTAVKGNRVYLDAPVAQSLESRYGGADLQHYTWDRVKGCGVENLTVDCKYDKSNVYNGNEVDEAHAWQAVMVKSAEHCWIRKVTSRHMGYALADLGSGARCITVEDCNCLSPVSTVGGARRYAFCLTGNAELCLFKNCYCEDDRHSFVANGTVTGPNVFTGCRSIRGKASIGPHWGWASATLYDCIEADSNFEAQDGGCQGTGHGWRGVNTVFWNVSTTAQIVAQNVWGKCFSCGTDWNQTSVCSNCGKSIVPSGRNYAVGCVGTKVAKTLFWDRNYYGNPTDDFFVTRYGYGSFGENRPDGEWYPVKKYGESGGTPVMLPHEASVSWWPVFTITSFSNPKSLYQCQLEDRHARGIYLNTL